MRAQLSATAECRPGLLTTAEATFGLELREAAVEVLEGPDHVQQGVRNVHEELRTSAGAPVTRAPWPFAWIAFVSSRILAMSCAWCGEPGSACLRS
jgi:hypothetical protein